MASKVATEREAKQQAMDDVMVILEIIRELDDVDLFGRNIEFKAVLINRLSEEIDKI